MDWRLAGQAQSAILEFMVDGQPVVPDADSIIFTSWDNAGVQIISAPFLQPVDAVPTQMEVVLDSGLNSIASGALFESRYLRADFTFNTRPYFVTQSYRLHGMIPTTVKPQNVRALVGADVDEIPDVDIDIVGAYIELMSSFGANLQVALIRTDAISLAANQAIALQVAVNLCPSLQSRLLKSEKSDNAGFQRADMDFLKLEADLRTQLTDKLGQIILVLDGTTISSEPHTIFAVTKQTDRITNSDA